LFHRENQESPNFILSGVLIFAAAKIYGRKVDFLEQEILGVAKNFEQIDADADKQDKSKDPREVKRARTKRYAINDGVNLERTTFEEAEIKVVSKSDINKTLAEPSRLSRLQKIKEFSDKNKARSGTLPIPKSMMLINDTSVTTNFGDSLIRDHDDHKEIVGSRKDFTSFSYYINDTTGELEIDINFSSNKLQRRTSDEYFPPEPQLDATVMNDDDNTIIIDNALISQQMEEIRVLTPPPTPPSPLRPLSPATHSDKAELSAELNISIDEGIDIDYCSHLLSPIIKLSDILKESSNLFPPNVKLNESFEMNFSRSVIAVKEHLKHDEDFSLPANFKEDIANRKLRNIAMIPMKRLKRRCHFDLPQDDEDFRELKRRKMEQFKPTSATEASINRRIFKPHQIFNDSNLPVTPSAFSGNLEEYENAPFRGFTVTEQNESPLYNRKKHTTHLPPPNTTNDITDNHTSLGKESDDSGFDSECVNTSNELSTATYDESDACNENELSNKDPSSADSCIGSSLASGNSGLDKNNSSLPSFFDEFSVNKNSTAIEEHEIDLSLETSDQSAQELEVVS
jgi:hypothetical protein